MMKRNKITAVILSLVMSMSLMMPSVEVLADEASAPSETQKTETVETKEPKATEKQTPKETKKQEPKETEKQEPKETEKQEPKETEKQEPKETEKQESEATEDTKPEETEGTKPSEIEEQKPSETEPSGTEKQTPSETETKEPDETEETEPEETAPEVKPHEGTVTTARSKAKNEVSITKTQDNTYFGTSNISAPKTPNGYWAGSFVYFGTYDSKPIKFRVLAPSTTEYGGTTMLLDCDCTLFNMRFDDDSNVWANSEIKSYLNGDFLNGFTLAELNAIAQSTRETGTTENYVALKGERVFLLDKEDVHNYNYGYESQDVGCMNRNKSGSDSVWTLRSAAQGQGYSFLALAVGSNGKVGTVNVDKARGICPALNINLSSVIFSSKVYSTYWGDEYKLTLKDPNLTIAVPSGQQPEMMGTKVIVPYTIGGRNKGTANRVSYLITNKAGTEIKYYNAMNGGASGMGTFDLPSDLSLNAWGKNYEVYILAEQANKSQTTDYASDKVKLDKPVATSKELIASGYCGADGNEEKIFWLLDSTGLLTIKGMGEMNDWDSTPPWYEHREAIRSVVFSGNITSIGDRALYYCESLTSITIPNSVTSIGIEAFSGCSALKDVYYDGTEAGWKDITIWSSNEPLQNANIQYAAYSITVNSGMSDLAKATEGTTVTVTANAASSGKVFDKWIVVSGNVAFANELSSTTTFTMPAENVEVTAVYKDVEYIIKVNNGSATPATATAGTIITLTADAAPSGKAFDKWIAVSGSVKFANSGLSSVTWFTMPAENVEVTATYKDVEYTIKVNNGSATPTTATAGTVITLTADAAPSGRIFDKWIVNSGTVSLSNASTSTTTFTMPAENVEVTATYKDVEYTIKVNNGSASPATASAGTVIVLTADAAPSGKAFDKWIVVSGTVKFTNSELSSVTTFTMPAGNVEITATYKTVPSGKFVVKVNSGFATPSISAPGLVVNVTANDAPDGTEFDKWEVVSGTVIFADASSATTSFVMPAGDVEITAKYKSSLSVKGKTATVKYSKVKKKNQTLAVSKVLTFVDKGQGQLTYAKVSGNSKILINKTTGAITVKKKLKKKTYTVKVKVMASGNESCNPSGWKTVTFKIKVK